MSKSIVPHEVRSRILRLLQKYGEMSLISIVGLYRLDYGESLDPAIYGYTNGLIEMFSTMLETVTMFKFRNITMCKPSQIILNSTKANSAPQIRVDHLSKRQKINRSVAMSLIADLSNEALWFSDLLRFYFKRGYADLNLARSPYEDAISRQPIKMAEIIRQISAELKKHPKGMRLSDLSKFPEYIFRNYFKENTIAQAVEDYPEIFYSIQPDDYVDSGVSDVTDESESSETIVFDGRTTTVAKLDQYDLKPYDLTKEQVIYYCIKSGLYQKTILLIRKANFEGLKLSVWGQSINQNFTAPPAFKMDQAIASEYQKKIDHIYPVTIFQVLASDGLLKIQSNPDCVNDLRLFPPEKALDWAHYHHDLQRKIGLIAPSTT